MLWMKTSRDPNEPISLIDDSEIAQALATLESATGNRTPRVRGGVYAALWATIFFTCAYGLAFVLFENDWAGLIAASAVLVCLGSSFRRVILRRKHTEAGRPPAHLDDIRALPPLTRMLG